MTNCEISLHKACISLESYWEIRIKLYFNFTELAMARNYKREDNRSQWMKNSLELSAIHIKNGDKTERQGASRSKVYKME